MRTVLKRVLVTGGAGFLGSHLCERLRAEGHDVLCVDNYFTGRKENIGHLLGDPNFEAMRHDVTFPLYVEVDEIFNLACPASPMHYQFDPVQTTKTSVIGAINMLGLARRVKAKILQDALRPPLLGEHTLQILGDWLGLDATRAEDYATAGAFGSKASHQAGAVV